VGSLGADVLPGERAGAGVLPGEQRPGLAPWRASRSRERRCGATSLANLRTFARVPT
jgi:hypothetical protein